MNWRKFLLIGVAVIGLGFAASPRADAGISVGIGLGFPIRGHYGYGYGGHYGCGYPGYYPYGYGDYPYYGYGSRAVIYVGPRYHRHHVRRVYHRHRYYR